ncbi:MAG: hypothetical protein IPN95_10915 [Bacteroidetes bacterium]|nr:hypothetical protein [Bacteroidota bacterium]
MKLPLLKKYALNCFLLTIPILVWNILLADQLPEAYQEAVFWNMLIGNLTSRTRMGKDSTFQARRA